MSKKNRLSIYDHQLNGILYKVPFLIWPLFWFHSLMHSRKHVVLSAAKRAIRSKKQKVSVLDAGCGEGNFLIPLAHRFKKQTFSGLDLNPSLVSFVNAYASYFKLPITAKTCDLNLLVESADYDVVLSVAVLHMLQDDKRFLEKIHGLLCQGGKLVLNVPLKHRPILERWSKLANGYNEHYNTDKKYSLEEIVSLLQDIGFSVVEKNPTNGKVGTLANELLNLSLQAIQKGSLFHRILHSFLFSFVVFPCVLVLNLWNALTKKQPYSGVVLVAEKSN